jgi:hypothetical protein
VLKLLENLQVKIGIRLVRFLKFALKLSLAKCLQTLLDRRADELASADAGSTRCLIGALERGRREFDEDTLFLGFARGAAVRRERVCGRWWEPCSLRSFQYIAGYISIHIDVQVSTRLTTEARVHPRSKYVQGRIGIISIPVEFLAGQGYIVGSGIDPLFCHINLLLLSPPSDNSFNYARRRQTTTKLPLQLLNGNSVVGVDADVPGNPHRLLGNLARGEICVLKQRPGRSRGVAAAGPDRCQCLVRINHVP